MVIFAINRDSLGVKNACKNFKFIRNGIENQPSFDVSHFDIRNTFGK